MIGDGGLEEERQVGEDGSECLLINVNSCQELTQHQHIDHDRNGKEGILANVVRRDCVYSAKEDLGSILVEGSLRVANERHILNNNFVIDMIITLWVEQSVRLDSIVKNTSLGYLFRLEALVLRQVLSIIVAQVVV